MIEEHKHHTRMYKNHSIFNQWDWGKDSCVMASTLQLGNLGALDVNITGREGASICSFDQDTPKE